MTIEATLYCPFCGSSLPCNSQATHALGTDYFFICTDCDMEWIKSWNSIEQKWNIYQDQ